MVQRSKKKNKNKGRSGAASSSAAASVRPLQYQIDLLYHRIVSYRGLQVVVHARDKGGFGDLINCLKTCQIVLDSGEPWTVRADSDHGALRMMLTAFPGVEALVESREFPEDPRIIDLLAVSQGGNARAGSIEEYGYISERDAASPYARGAGFAPWEIGIMIDHALRGEQISLDSLALASQPLGAAIQFCCGGFQALPRFFFGYGAGQKDSRCIRMLMDRVVFDPTIREALVLLPGHGENNVDEYFKTRERAAAANGVGLDFTRAYDYGRNRPTPIYTNGAFCYELTGAHRRIVLMVPTSSVPYTDMRQLWLAADRSFTVCEGDQSFSEAISCGIPMGYQLWNPSSGSPHKTKLFEDLLKWCQQAGFGDVKDFLSRCRDYMKKAFDPKGIVTIVSACNDGGFLSRYRQCMQLVAAQRDIAVPIIAFLKRSWLRKLGEILPGAEELLEPVFKVEDTGGRLEDIAHALEAAWPGVLRLLPQPSLFQLASHPWDAKLYRPSHGGYPS